jgi:hypothetical protein
MVITSFTFTKSTIVSLELMHVQVNWHILTSFMVVKSFVFTISLIVSLKLVCTHKLTEINKFFPHKLPSNHTFLAPKSLKTT